jgi:hypothetical protein
MHLVPDFAEWGVPLLVTQLFDPSIEVCEMSVFALNEVCEDPRNLESLVQLRPYLELLAKEAGPLFLRFLSSPQGYKYLEEIGYIEREMNAWLAHGNEEYVVQVELMLEEVLNTEKRTEKTQHWSDSRLSIDSYITAIKEQISDGRTPVHFFGELVKTSLGCDLLKNSERFNDFTTVIRKFGFHNSHVLEVKAALWAVVNTTSRFYIGTYWVKL